MFNNEVNTAVACDCEAKNAISAYARKLCENLTENEIDAVFAQMLYLEETVSGGNFETLIEGLGDSFRIEKFTNDVDIDALMETRDIDLESVTLHEVGDSIIVTYDC